MALKGQAEKRQPCRFSACPFNATFFKNSIEKNRNILYNSESKKQILGAKYV